MHGRTTVARWNAAMVKHHSGNDQASQWRQELSAFSSACDSQMLQWSSTTVETIKHHVAPTLLTAHAHVTDKCRKCQAPHAFLSFFFFSFLFFFRIASKPASCAGMSAHQQLQCSSPPRFSRAATREQSLVPMACASKASCQMAFRSPRFSRAATREQSLVPMDCVSKASCQMASAPTRQRDARAPQFAPLDSIEPRRASKASCQWPARVTRSGNREQCLALKDLVGSTTSCGRVRRRTLPASILCWGSTTPELWADATPYPPAIVIL
jgi:hypothetical protein